MITSESEIRFAFKVLRGHGLDGRRDGLCKNRLLASYTHVHAGGDPQWAKGLFDVAACERVDEKKFTRQGIVIIDIAVFFYYMLKIIAFPAIRPKRFLDAGGHVMYYGFTHWPIERILSGFKSRRRLMNHASDRI